MIASVNGYPTRVVLNFSHRCALNCEWCYVPFEAKRAQRRIVADVVDRVASLGFQAITFGGGDPFQYSYVGGLARQAKAAGLQVHIDTHGKSLTASQANRLLVVEAVDILGLPLDGPNSELHDGMRSAPGHFEIVMKRLRWLKKVDACFKINTVVSRRNIGSLAELAALIHGLAPWRWSVYQYMPLGPGAAVSSTHSLDLPEFQTAITDVGKTFGMPGAPIFEVADKDSRRATYPIVRHDGSVFVHSNERPDIFLPVCSIFDALAREKINKACGPERLTAMSRYFPIRATSRV